MPAERQELYHTNYQKSSRNMSLLLNLNKKGTWVKAGCQKRSAWKCHTECREKMIPLYENTATKEEKKKRRRKSYYCVYLANKD
jgi:hypothetical protein